MAGSKSRSSHSKRSFSSPNVGLQLHLETPCYQQYPDKQTDEPDEDTWEDPEPLQTRVTSMAPRSDLSVAENRYLWSGGTAGLQNTSSYPASASSQASHPEFPRDEATPYQGSSNYQLATGIPLPQFESALATASTTTESAQELTLAKPTSDLDVVRALKMNSSSIRMLIQQLQEDGTQISRRPSQITKGCDELLHLLLKVRATYCFQYPSRDFKKARKIFDEKERDIIKLRRKIEKAQTTFVAEGKKTKDQLTSSDNVIYMLNLAIDVVDENRHCDEVFDILAKAGATGREIRHQDRMNNEEVNISRCANAVVLIEAIGNLLGNLIPNLSVFGV